MTSSFSNLVNNLSEGIHRIKLKYGHDNKKCQTCGIKYKYCDCLLEHANFKDDLIEYYKCLLCNKNCQWKFDEKLNEQFFNTYEFSMIKLSLLCCWEKMFVLMNIWIIGKNSMKHRYLKKKIFTFA